jgi:hypothetical protein
MEEAQASRRQTDSLNKRFSTLHLQTQQSYLSISTVWRLMAQALRSETRSRRVRSLFQRLLLPSALSRLLWVESRPTSDMQKLRRGWLGY